MSKNRRAKTATREIKTSSGPGLDRLELAVALLLTAVVAVCHFVVFRHAGPLWRDEASTTYLSNLPTFSDLLNHLQFESFPLAWQLVIRTCGTICGVGNDGALRLLGFLVGLGLTAALWLTVRRCFKLSTPLLALVLVGLNPMMLMWGDSLRAYGFGCLTIILAAGLLWRVVQEPTTGRFLLAALAALLTVQTLYHNAFLLFALAAAGLVVAARRRQWRRAGLVAAIGLVAALSLLPYYGPIHRAGEWNNIINITTGLSHYWSVYAQLLGSAGEFMVTVWLLLMAAAVVAAALAQSPRLTPGLSQERRDLALFASLTLVIALAAYAAFLTLLRYPTNPWYYLALLALAAVTLEAALAAWAAGPAVRIGRLLLAVILAAACLNSGWEELQTRRSNIDLIAAALQSKADQDDLILVSSWTEGVSFYRYYHGATPWQTIPPLEDHQLHRYDLIKADMMRPDAARGNEEALEKTLTRRGHKVWIVGGLPVFRPGQAPAYPGTPPLVDTGWYAPPYENYWPAEVGYFLQSHVDLRKIRLEQFGEHVSDFENPDLEVVEGWHD